MDTHFDVGMTRLAAGLIVLGVGCMSAGVALYDYRLGLVLFGVAAAAGRYLAFNPGVTIWIC